MEKLYSYISIFCLILLLSVPANAQHFEIDPHKTAGTGYGCGFLEGGYGSDLSAYKGDTLKFYISTHDTIFNLKIYRYGKTKECVKTIYNLKGGIREVKEEDRVYVNGCKWPETARIVIPEDWKPGAYLAEFPTYSDTVNPVLFFVKDKNTTNRLLVVCHTNTYQAYNMFGGKSNYPAYSSEGGPGMSYNYSNKLSFFRPFNLNNHIKVNRGSFYAYDAKLIKWLEEEGYDVDVVSDTDLDRDSLYLSRHKVLLIAGHSEYWSRKMRQNVEDFLNKGGHFMCLSGNTCWWQMRYEDNYHTYVCYKHNYYSDPDYGKSTGSQEWYTIERENPFLGTSYENGGQVNYYYSCLLWTEGYGGYIVTNSQHWAYQNTGLSEGDTLGYNRDSSVVGYETDAALFTFRNGLPVVTGTDKTPSNFTLLGLSSSNKISANIPQEWATMGIFQYNKEKNPKAGYVFNTATIRWTWGLTNHKSQVSLMTKNVIEHFLKNSFPPEFVSWHPYAGKSEVRLGKKMPFNYREIELQQGKNLDFRVSATDPGRGAVSYYWTINDTIVPGADRVLRFNSLKHINGINTVKAYAFNSKDTSLISWKVNVIEGGSDIKIANRPDQYFTPGQNFSFMINTDSRKGALVHYRIDHIPDWMTYDPSENIIQGIPKANAAAEDSIVIAAVDNLGNIDHKSFKISSMGATSIAENNAPGDYSLFQNYPNPFNGSTKIRFYVKNISAAEVVITDVLGQRVRSYKLGQVTPGFYDVTWDGKNEYGSNVSSGIYLYKVTCSELDSPVFTMVKKMTYLK